MVVKGQVRFEMHHIQETVKISRPSLGIEHIQERLTSQGSNHTRKIEKNPLKI